MRVLHLVNYGWPRIDGYTVRTSGLVTAQREQLGWDVRVATGPFPPFTASTDEAFTTSAWGPGQPVLGDTRPWERPGLGVAPAASTSLARELGRVLEADPVDVLHVHHPHPLFGPARRVADRHGIPVVYEVRCFNGDYDLDRRHPWFRHVRGPLYNRLEARALRAADVAVTISDGLAERIRRLGVERVHVVRNSVDGARFADPGDRRPARPGVARVGYATSFEPIESLDVLVEALVIARDRLAGEVELQAVIAGGGRTFDDVRAQRDAAGAAGWLELPGFVPYHRMPALLADLDLFVVPRGAAAVVRDTTPLKPLEALAAGTPVLSTDLPALRELLGAHPDVRFVGTSATELAEGVVAGVRAGARADPDAVDRSWTTEVSAYEAVYADALDPTRRRHRTGGPRPFGRFRRSSGTGRSSRTDRPHTPQGPGRLGRLARLGRLGRLGRRAGGARLDPNRSPSS